MFSLRSRGPNRRFRVPRARAGLSRPGMGRARRGRDPRKRRARPRRGARSVAAGGNPGARRDEPARDGRRVGLGDGRARRKRDRLAGHPDRRRLPRADRDGDRRGGARADGPSHPDVFLGDEDSLDSRACSGGGPPRRRGAAADRHDGRLGHLEPDRRSGGRSARHRSDERVAHAPLRARHAAVGPLAPGAFRSLRAGAAADPPLDRRGAVRLDARGRPARGSRARLRRSRRPAVRPLRAGVLFPGGREEHLRDGVFPSPARRRGCP